jgi:two-component system response regulator YesN
MWKVLLVDDEIDIREGLTQLIDWEALGFTVAAKASNGKEALEALESRALHLVIADISMPVMTGLELIKEMRARGLSQSVIILSAYNDFEYLKEALKYRVENYLLKPVDDDELTATLLQVKEDIRQDLAVSMQEKENLNILRSKILNRLVTRNISPSEFSNKADFLQIDLTAVSYRVILVELENVRDVFERTGEPAEHWKLFSAQNVCAEIMGAYADGIWFEDALQRLVFIAKQHVSGEPADYHAAADEIKAALKRFVKEPASVIIGPEVRGVREIHASYSEALKLLEYKFYLGREATISEQRIPARAETIDMEIEGRIRELEQFILAGDEASCQEVTRCIYDSFKEHAKISKSFVHHATFEILMSALRLIREAHGDVTQVLERPERLYEDILSHKTIDDMRGFLDGTLKQILDYLSHLRQKRPPKVVLNVLNYMKDNYNKEITLKQAAETVFVNAGYLGKLFKKETGYSFHDYLNKIRIDKARELLLTTNHYVYQVSEMVGYKDYNYFHRTFKKWTGRSPSEL